jgi:hypothetical protein
VPPERRLSEPNFFRTREMSDLDGSPASDQCGHKTSEFMIVFPSVLVGQFVVVMTGMPRLVRPLP